MYKLVSVTEIRKIEQQADEKGLSFAKMMENAGLGLAKVIRSMFEPATITGLVGPGNNGGDTLVALAALAKAGWKSKAYLVRPRASDDPLIKWLIEVGGEIITSEQDDSFKQLDECIRSSQVLLDGVLGTGIKLPLRPDIATLLKRISDRKSRAFVIAVDCPSGVDCDSGEAASECIPADLTVCMAAIKIGLLRFPAYSLTGKLHVVDIGLSSNIKEWASIQRNVVTCDDVAKVIPQRIINAHKGTFGTALIVAGSINYPGAALLAAKAAYRIGSGLVRLAVPGVIHGALAGHLPEATWLILPGETGVISENAIKVLMDNLGKTTAMLLGPGWGMEDTTEGFLRRLLGCEVKTGIGFAPIANQDKKPEVNLPPLVLDADGLKHLAAIPDWFKKLPEGTILTPHPGEMSQLCGLDIKEIEENRLEIAEVYAKKWGCILVLKGALTIVAAPDSRTNVIPIATAALARAGTGDVLAGIITGMLAQGVTPFEAAYASAWIHGQAGILAKKRLGHAAAVLAGDVIDSISEVLSK